MKDLDRPEPVRRPTRSRTNGPEPRHLEVREGIAGDSPVGPGRSAALSDEELVGSFESCTLPEDRFGHADHVRVAWIYLRRMPLLEAIERFRSALRRFAASHGEPDLYHETVTWAYLVLVHQRISRGPRCGSWPEFALENPDLLCWKNGVFFDHYSETILENPEARAIFVLPRRGGSRDDEGGNR